MIFASCPLCDESIVVPIAKAGSFERITCEGCGAELFLHHSRWRPHVYLPSQLIIDEETKTIEFADKEAQEQFWSDYHEAAIITGYNPPPKNHTRPMQPTPAPPDKVV